jgi:hypothetical protein
MDINKWGTMFMGLFDKLFATRNKTQWEVLKIFVSVSKDRSTSLDRVKLVDKLLATFEESYGQLPELLDIGGPYGIKKGKPVGVKRFNNLLRTKGYEKFYALTMSDKKANAWIHFLDNAHELDTKNWPFGYQELIIGHKKPTYSSDLLRVANDIFEVFKFDYGYITQLPDNYDLINESRIRNMLGMITSGHSKEDWTWRNNTNKVLTGDIKDVYVINLLNDKQANKIKSMNFVTKEFNDKIHLWTVENDKVRAVRDKLKEDLIINTVANKMHNHWRGSV